jgi:triosephosphate isomerase
MRKQIAAANWKMNLTLAHGEKLLDDVLGKVKEVPANHEVVFAVPFPYLPMAKQKTKGLKNIFVAAQNCSNKKSGAYTGEVSVDMLVSLEVNYVILGHSERREYFQESNQLLAEKLDICLAANLIPIFCCGESLLIREAGTQNEFVGRQLAESLFHLSADELKKVIIAYEPIWAIGTGKTATSDQAQEMHAFIRSRLAKQYGNDTANAITILYGGSVKASNASDIFSRPDVDGGLVGGASLIGEEFIAIISALK